MHKGRATPGSTAEAPILLPMTTAGTHYTQLHAGYLFTPEDELNSLALQGVGSKTNLDYIQIHNGADDGIEFYGGNVDGKHLYLTGIDDDSLDWTTGYTGRLQHVLIKLTNTGDNCIEADNLVQILRLRGLNLLSQI